MTCRRWISCGPPGFFKTPLPPRGCGLGVGGGSGFHDRGRGGFGLGQSQRFAQIAVDRLPDVGIVFEELARVLAALTDALALVAEPRPALLDQVLRHSEIEQVAFPRNAFAVRSEEHTSELQSLRHLVCR